MEQIINIKFCYRLGETATKLREILNEVYGEKTLFCSRTFEWFCRLREDLDCVVDEAHCGMPHSICTPETIEKVRKQMTSDRRLTIRGLRQ